MSICIIQPNDSTKYLKLGSYDPVSNTWSFRQTLIPAECDDSRFRDAVRLLSKGWQLFTQDNKIYRVNESLRAIIDSEPLSANRGVETRKIDFSGFWRRYDLDQKMKIDPIGTVLDSKVSLLIARHNAGEKLPAYVLDTIKKYL